MRHIRARRRLKVVLIALFAISATLFAETRLEEIVPQIKALAESKIEKSFGNRFAVSIGNIEGGILRPLVLNDCRIRDKSGKSLFESLDIVTIKSDFNAWDILFKGKGRGYVDINFMTKNKEASGFCRIKGDLDNSEIKGRLDLFGGERIDFAGVILNDTFKLDLNTKGGTLKAEGTLSEDGVFIVNIRANHFRIFGFDIVSGAILTAAKDGGRFETKNFILNYKPFPDLAAVYKISDGVLDIKDFEIGKNIKVYGRVPLKSPLNLDIVVTADNVDLSRFMSNIGVKDSSSILSGMMSGKFELKGPMDRLKSNIRLEMKKGTIGAVDFDYLTAAIKGDGPVLHIEDSRITRESGYFVLAGDIDLSRRTTSGIFEGIKIVTTDTAINWDGLNTTKLRDVREVSLEKKMSDDVNINFKKFIAEDSIDEALKDRDEIEVEYKLHPKESLKMMIGQDKDFLGLEHKDRF